MKIKIVISLLCSLLLISACATRLDQTSPINTDLSGTWVLDREASQTVILSPARQAGGGMSGNGAVSGNTGMGGGGMGGNGGGMGGNDSDQPNGSDDTQGGFGGGPQLTSAMKTVEMTIEQNHDSMGVAYPDELYRDIDWGEKEFYRETVTAGWQDLNLIVKSVGRQMTITETYSLNPTKDRLTLTLLIKGQRDENTFVRVFNLKK